MGSEVTIGLSITGFLVFLILAIIVASFGYLEYDQYGFLRQKSTSRVFTDNVYKGGRHFIGPDFEFKIYPATARTISLYRITVFSSDTLAVYISVQLQYFLRPEQLSILHKNYQLTYHTVIKTSTIDALKAAAVNFTTEDFIKDRNRVEKAMEEAVRLRIGGKCCEANCNTSTCLPNCIPLTACTNQSDMGMMVNMRYFHLAAVVMPSKVYGRYLKALLLVEESQMEKHRLDEAVVKKEVYEEVKVIYNKANEIAQNATAQAKLIRRRAEAESLKVVGEARGEGLRILMSVCGITDAMQKMSLHYLSSLGENNQARLAVDFNNYVIGGK